MPAIDKQAHFWAGATIGSVAFVFTNSVAVSLLIVVAAGLLKEVYDKVSGKGTPEALDFFATVLGGLVTVALGLIAMQL